jgi:hypothetical protein
VKRSSLAAAVLATAAAGMVMLAPGRAGPPAPTPGPSQASPAIPWLTEAEKSQAAHVLASDPRAKALFEEASYTVADIGPWTTSYQKRIGAVMTIRLDTPKSFPVVEWPAVQTDWGAGFPHYRERTLPASATDVRDFDVLVDLNRARMVSLRPRNAEKMKIAPWMAPWPKVTPSP